MSKSNQRKAGGSRNILVIDCNAICHAAKYSVRGLSYDEMETGIIYGFMAKLLVLQKQFKAVAIVFAWDSVKSKRKRLFPDYKKKRAIEKKPEDIELDKIAYPQFKELRRTILPELGFKNIFINTGYEADDIMAKIAFDDGFITCPDCDVVIVTRDNDLLQVLSPHTSMFDPQTKRIMTYGAFVEEYGIQPQEWSEVKAIGGCKSDEVPGVVGVAEKTAIKYLQGKMNTKSELYKRIKNSGDIIQRNRALVHLPYKGITLPEIKGGVGIDFLEFTRICGKFGFSSFLKLKKYNEWQQAFGQRRLV